MALNLSTTTANKALLVSVHKSFLPTNKDLFRLCPALRSAAAQSEARDDQVQDDSALIDAGSLTSTRAQLGLLEQLTSSAASGYVSDSSSFGELTIREQLEQLVSERDDDFIIALGKKNLKKVSPKFLTTSQKRNIRRQAYLNEVSQRNDSVFFASIGAFVILPPVVILGVAILTGYVQLFP